MKAQLSEAECASRIKHDSCGIEGVRFKKGKNKRGNKSLQFQVWFRSENDEAVNQVKAKLLKIVQSERSNSKDDVRPDKSHRFVIRYQF